MSKRNFTLLIIILILGTVGFFVFLYSRGETPRGEGGEGTNFIARFNPFSNKKPAPEDTGPTEDTSSPIEDPEEKMLEVELKKVSSMEIAGFGVFTKERLKEMNPSPALPLSGEEENPAPPAKGGSGSLKPTPPPTEFATAVRYVARATGNIYQTFADKIIERKFSGTLIPKVYEAHFGNHGGSVVMRYLKGDEKTIETFFSVLPKEYLGGDATENNEIKGSFLPNNIKDISLSSDTSKIFYLFESESNLGESIIGTTLSLLDNKKVQIFDSPFTEWLSSWPNNKIITLSTKPSANTPGYMYSIDGVGKNLTKILGDINGLTTLTSPDGKLVLYSDNNLTSYIYHTDTKSSDLLGIKTLPEKCVWGGGSDIFYCAVPKLIGASQYPDTWYQGEESFSDQIWKIDVETGNATMIEDPIMALGGEDVDGIKLALDEGESYLFFVNKKDSFLWELKLK
ncbi:hypothetical protein A3A95_00270 [Candidatus Nomurabacteria bacterium RIFCSPLOWO2_01_FULL_39_18]|uniref:Uncharacterized protein n=1 Tax=Candidatus Nomurabacteria bacterium RIFCSPHIGHO2_01_FULL_40_24b TaxID=1801739 RepID=A0A1F6V9B4_9BACT|nr:MAG: hypothetical protein A2647_03120 [Candidatus Nomurabacteria bacterium RIFCSPHIGHO2_01_FULL_40_24b]OGI90511.1 MAG: hypothetical protein A3A95_00270 [Candidatus Nomurabacteria bacterium RIFCSPLOWO2_01_FULL_39_18]